MTRQPAEASVLMSLKVFQSVVLASTVSLTQYTIGYTPLNQSLDGSYRAIRVTVRGRAH